MKRIKILFDPDGEYGYGTNRIITCGLLIEHYIESLNEVECADTIAFIKNIEIEKAVDFIAEAWGLEYEFV